MTTLNETYVNSFKINRLTKTQLENAGNLSPSEAYFEDPEFVGGKLLVTTADGDIVESSQTIPTVNNPTITITQGGVSKGSFTLNQSTGDTIALDAGGGSSVEIDGLSITKNSGDELQTIGVINQNNTSTALKQWSGTKAQYDLIATKDANTVYNITDDTTPSNFANVNLSNLSQTGQAIIDGKVDLDASNLSTQGKSLISGLGMPSNRYIDLTRGASGATYTAPANGWFNAVYHTTASSSTNSYLDFTNETNGVCCRSLEYSSGTQIITSLIPAKKGDIVSLSYDGLSATGNDRFRFYYAEGEPNV